MVVAVVGVGVVVVVTGLVVVEGLVVVVVCVVGVVVTVVPLLVVVRTQDPSIQTPPCIRAASDVGRDYRAEGSPDSQLHCSSRQCRDCHWCS